MLSLTSEKLGVGQDCTSVDGNRSFRISLRIPVKVLCQPSAFLAGLLMSGWVEMLFVSVLLSLNPAEQESTQQGIPL